MKTQHIILFICILLIVIVAASLILPRQRELNKNERLLVEKQAEAKRLGRELDGLQKENTELENNDPNRFIKTARDTYGYCNPGETVYHFPEEKEK